MKGLITSFLLFIFLIFIYLPPSYSKDQFKPWNSDVSIADEKISIIESGDNLHSKYHKIKPHYIYTSKLDKPGVRNVYTGFKGGAFFLIRIFQVVISPQDGPNCRYSPTCSAYGKLAVEKYGAFMGSVLAGDRLLRCNPFAPHGHDPVLHLGKTKSK